MLAIGGEDPKILPDCEYPPWLFELRLERRKELEDLDPEVDGWLYWQEYRWVSIVFLYRIHFLRIYSHAYGRVLKN